MALALATTRRVPVWAWAIAAGLLGCSVIDAAITLFVMHASAQAGASAISAEANPVMLALGLHSVVGVVAVHLLWGVVATVLVVWVATSRPESRRLIAAVGGTVLALYGGFVVWELLGVAQLLPAVQELAAAKRLMPEFCAQWRAKLPQLAPSAHAAVRALIQQNC